MVVLRKLKINSGDEKIFHDIAPKTFARAVKKSGLNDGIRDRRQKVVFHTLRHTFASWLIQEGVSLYIVGQLLGHSDIKMTMRYAHIDKKSHLMNAVMKLNGKII